MQLHCHNSRILDEVLQWTIPSLRNLRFPKWNISLRTRERVPQSRTFPDTQRPWMLQFSHLQSEAHFSEITMRSKWNLGYSVSHSALSPCWSGTASQVTICSCLEKRRPSGAHSLLNHNAPSLTYTRTNASFLLGENPFLPIRNIRNSYILFFLSFEESLVRSSKACLWKLGVFTGVLWKGFHGQVHLGKAGLPRTQCGRHSQSCRSPSVMECHRWAGRM